MTPAPGAGTTPHPVQLLDLGQLDYHETHERQRALVTERANGIIKDTLVVVEHPPVFTRGRKSKDNSNILNPGDVPIIDVERGGDITFHGPGQLVVYPIFQLREDERDAPGFIRRLERWIIEALQTLGVTEARRKWGFTGVWCGDKKLASIGIAVTARWITWHGIAINLSTDLTYFERINPCGLRAGVMTNVETIIQKPVSMEQTKTALLQQLPKHLNRAITPATVGR